MHLSHRVQSLASSATLAVNARIKELQAEGVDVIGFGAGEPDFDTPQNIKDAAIAALNAGMTKYAPVPGEPAAREAIANKLRQDNGIRCSAKDIVISVGGKHSIYLALQCLLDGPRNANDPPQEVILPTPAWVSYEPMVQLAGGAAVQVAGAVERDFLITAEQLEAAITPRTRAFIINSPSNPCGTMYSPQQLRELAAVLAMHPNVVVISDEMYEKLIYGDVPHFSLGSVESIADRVVTVGGMSKAFAMTGWRIGYACAPGPLAAAMSKLQGQMTSNITSFCYPAIVEAFTSPRSAESVEVMRRAFAARAKLICRWMDEMPGLRCPNPTGAFYVFPDVSAYFGGRSPGGRLINSALDFAAALLEEARVAVVPGEDFGEVGRSHVRLSFACSEAHVEEGCRRMKDWLEKMATAVMR
ncbi:MAG TPA: pyridoxal phosphate-dependent aminotransferase [Phycisphaerales bacterium]|nr:pyridoxal phosphate-dependent aminotransferase [Phycisphaerales bacterium]HRQ76106.1 pyridoxal phosphate-dependent aminotransferase [Phycisphaerales bacterium]